MNLQVIRKNNYVLTPGRYIDFKAIEEDDEAFEEKMKKLSAILKEQMGKGQELDEIIKSNLGKIGYEL